MKPDQDPELTPSREAATTKGRVTPVPAERSPDDRAGESRPEAEEVSRREALKGRVDPASDESAPDGPVRDGDRTANGDGRAARPSGTVTTARAAKSAGTDGRGAPGDGRTGRTGRTGAEGDDSASGVPGASRESGPSRASGPAEGSGPRSVPRDAGEGHPVDGPEGTGGRTGDSARRDERMLPLDEQDKFSLRMRHAVGGFIDGPQASVEEADHVLEELAGRFTEAVTRRRRDLRTSWQSGAEAGAADSDTERLRLALRDYREMTERLLRL
ncbi:hypothetical protein ACFYXJ_36445 [Streptomyces sp. NPDC002667]|uniref:hypothetical protein n=1 Tax=Streptomyces sp. NPDC002667 TaxID=3364657 RepID=UPI00369F1D13